MRAQLVSLPPSRRLQASGGLPDREARAPHGGNPTNAPPRQDRPAGSGQPSLRPPSLLIVDDDPLMTDLLPRRLRRVTIPQLRILTASTPEDALRVMADEQPDVILSDYNLRAALNGIDVLQAAANRAPHAVRILFSAHTRREIGARIDDAPIHGFLEKTMRLDELIRPLLRLIHETRGLDLARDADGA